MVYIAHTYNTRSSGKQIPLSPAAKVFLIVMAIILVAAIVVPIVLIARGIQRRAAAIEQAKKEDNVHPEIIRPISGSATPNIPAV